MSKTVRLGYEIGTGTAVDIPIGHMVITGQSQLAGKTTALEGLVERSGVQAISFVTKRGEGSFSNARRIDPYFRERADWQFVEAILESAMNQKMRFERAWIIRAARGAHTLADVRKNVAELSAKAKGGMNADMYMLLGEYLDLVVPLIAKLPVVHTVHFWAGLNVMDLQTYPTELQGLVIRSVLEWIYDHEKAVVTVIPEAWEFIPQTRGSPVKMAATALVRKGAGLGNFLWLDSQDIAGVEKTILRQASVWLLGVQREANEIKRTLEHIPAGVKKPRADDVANLTLGQFWACVPGRVVKVYAQPAWLDDADAQLIATGQMTVQEVRRAAPPKRVEQQSEDEMSKEDVQQILERLDRQTEANERSTAVLEKLVGLFERGVKVEAAPTGKLRPTIPTDDEAQAEGHRAAQGLESIYAYVVARLKKEAPTLLKLLTVKSEINVEVELQQVTMDASTLRGRLATLVARGFFDKGAGGPEVLAELKRLGGGTGDRANYSRELGWLTEKGFLTVEANGWQSVDGMKVNIKRK